MFAEASNVPVEIINKVQGQGRGAEGPIVKFQQQGMGIIKSDREEEEEEEEWDGNARANANMRNEAPIQH